eukprot:3737875-Ditylum_brightwellii.AAC.1
MDWPPHKPILKKSDGFFSARHSTYVKSGVDTSERQCKKEGKRPPMKKDDFNFWESKLQEFLKISHYLT